MAEIIRHALDAYLAWDDPTYTPCPSSTKGRPIHPRMNDGAFWTVLCNTNGS